MTKILAAAALAALIATPVSAQSTKSNHSDAALGSYAASDTQQAKSKKAKRSVAPGDDQPLHVWSYSGNPEYDVYVRGEYVGSDPDPRVRSTLRAEATRSYGNRD
jgi:opacity protein-like surface antigen